jgi:alkylation response protein AidB-like acyl-CoA dehydrogenase
MRTGTDEQRPIVQAAAEGKLMGCFAMTERDHGSNVRQIETEAVYDRERKEFVIHTPHAGAEKWCVSHLVVCVRVLFTRHAGTSAMPARTDTTPWCLPSC